MILSVAALRIKIIIVSVDMPHLLSKWLENKATNLVSRILKMRIPHLQSYVFLYFLKSTDSTFKKIIYQIWF